MENLETRRSNRSGARPSPMLLTTSGGGGCNAGSVQLFRGTHRNERAYSEPPLFRGFGPQLSMVGENGAEEKWGRH